MKHSYLFILAASSLVAADFAAEGKIWWSHIQYLADDKLEGRNVGTDGFKNAVDYVAKQFDRIGLKPAGTSGYFQQVKFESRLLAPDKTRLSLMRDGREQSLVLGQDASLSSGSDLDGSVDVPMHFVGYGMSIPEAGWDDLKGLDLRGKVAVCFQAAAPVEVSANVKSHFGAERWATLKKAGAVGMATLPNPRLPAATNPGGGAAAAGRGPGSGRAAAPPPPQPNLRLFDPALQDQAGQTISMSITRAGAEKFLERSGHKLEELEQLVRENKSLPSFPLVGTLRATASVKRGSMEAPNVVGILPGSDPKLKDEYVIMSAHLDHVGVGRPVNGDSIYNGAMDDASGVATVIEIARMLKDAGAKPKRSILFLAQAAEEKGLLGSKYFAARPTVPFAQIVADINLDMFMPLYPLKVIEVQGLVESTLGMQVSAAAKELGVEVQTDREPEQNRFIRSDQYSFIRRGVPSLAFKFGYEHGSPEEKIRADWVRDRYHKPSDDLAQPVDLAAAAKFNRVIMGLLERVANDPVRPSWYEDSFFRRFATTK